MAATPTIAVVVAFSLTSLSTVVVALRFYSRHFLVGKVDSSDWVMLLALIATWGSAAVNYYQVHFNDPPGPWDSREAFERLVSEDLLRWWIYRLVYVVDHCLIKVSILLFYNHIISSHKTFRRITRLLLTVVVLTSVGLFIATVFACVPVADTWSFEVFWNNANGIYDHRCYNPNIVWYFTAGFNLFSDLFIWILPIPFVLNLQTMPIRRRLGLAGILSIGIMAIVASAIRLRVLVVWLTDYTKQEAEMGNLLIWSQVEQHAGIISACIPFLRPLFRKLFKSQLLRRSQPSPSPVAKLMAAHFTPENPRQPRTPIIPSPSPTLGSSSFRAPQSSLSPILPMRAEFGPAIGPATTT